MSSEAINYNNFESDILYKNSSDDEFDVDSQ